MRMIVVAVALSLAAGAALADTDSPPPPFAGVWQGTVGTSPVTACFGEAGDPSSGAYYYMSHLKLIRLDHQDKAQGAWNEGFVETKTAPRWTLSATGADALSGTWTGTGKSLPISLKRVALSKEDDPILACGGLAFSAPRLPPPAVTRKPATRDGVAYTRLIVNVGKHLNVSIESFAFDGTSPAVTQLNTALAKSLPKPGVRTDGDYVDCVTGAAGAFGEEADYDDTITPDLISRRWLVVQEVNNGSCGGAHPNAEVDWRLYDRTTGGAVDPWSWFTADAAVPSRDDPSLPPQIGPKLLKMLIARWPRHDDCKDAEADSEGYWDAHPTRAGLAFWPQLPHVVFACSEDVVIPYRDLAPLLNAKGRAAIASIVEDLKALPPKAKHRA